MRRGKYFSICMWWGGGCFFFTCPSCQVCFVELLNLFQKCFKIVFFVHILWFGFLVPRFVVGDVRCFKRLV